jgi:hypothetical protein
VSRANSFPSRLSMIRAVLHSCLGGMAGTRRPTGERGDGWTAGVDG